MKKIIVLTIILATISLFNQELSFSGYARNYSGVLLDDSEYSIVQNTFSLKIEQSKGIVGFKANPYIYHYQDNNEVEFGLRELYLDIFFDTMDIRIGKQQVIWGKADGVFITDIISPKDLTEFLLPDFDEIRLGVTGMKLDYYIGGSTFEIVWLPVFTPTIIPETGSIWRVEPDQENQQDVPITKVFDNSNENITASLENSEFFGKFSFMNSFADLEFMAGYAWDDDFVMHSYTISTDSLIITPEYHRLGIIGGSFNKVVGPFVFKGEGAYYSGKYFSTTEMTDLDKVVEKDYINYLIGADYSLFGVNLSTQFIQKYILDYDDALVNDKTENMVTFLASDDYRHETLNLQVFLYYDFVESDALIRPKITYDLNDGFEVSVGANIFTGTEGIFGQYDKNDMLFAKLKYSF
ncbi:MAG: hypothetical protein PF574_01575 [Candidatus Delongbacteria bacterium]|jgi:hypothetical protein|nr:hypothetical protein [Candidatus Delongbacteria bacterium]